MYHEQGTWPVGFNYFWTPRFWTPSSELNFYIFTGIKGSLTKLWFSSFFQKSFLGYVYIFSFFYISKHILTKISLPVTLFSSSSSPLLFYLLLEKNRRLEDNNQTWQNKIWSQNHHTVAGQWKPTEGKELTRRHKNQRLTSLHIQDSHREATLKPLIHAQRTWCRSVHALYLLL